MASPPVMMKMNTARAWQIKNLATKMGTTATEALEYLINKAVQAGEIDDVLPGFEVTDEELPFITLKADGHRLPKMTPVVAEMVAENLHHAATAMEHGRGRPYRYGQDGATGEDFEIVVGRIGTGVILGFTEKNPAEGIGLRVRASMTRGMAADLARQIRAVTRAD